MFQYNFFAQPLPDPAAEHPVPDPRSRLVLSWGEHCVECAAPACYASCDLYTPTESGKCRRFVDGVRPVAGSAAAEVRFRRWGKLEAQGNAELLAAPRASKIERRAGQAAQLAHRLGKLASQVTANPRWANAPEGLFRRLNRWLSRRGTGSGPLPNLAVLDIANRDVTPVRLMLTVAVDKLRLGRDLTASQLPPPCAVPIDLPPGRSRMEQSLADASAIFASGLPFTLSLTPLDEAMPHLLIHQLDVVHEPALLPVAPDQAVAASGAAKLVIFDLDNTLWDGVLLEGPVALRPGIAGLFRELDERGILLSVASKNAPEDALAELARHGLDQFLLFPQVGWLPKSRSVKTIVETIDIGIDTVIFIDDNPFERAEVIAAHPQVEVLDDGALATLASHPRLQGAKTPESRQRRKMYQEAVERGQAATTFGGDYLDFLKASELTVTIRPDRPDDHERIAELVQRTNQLNFSGRKYDRAAITEALADGRMHLVIDCADRFGSYGTVGFCMAHLENGTDGPCLVVDDFMLSCRVQGKFVEQALLYDLVGRLAQPPVAIKVNFRKTERNRPAQLVLEEIGFTAREGEGYWLDPRTTDLSVPFLTVNSG